MTKVLEYDISDYDLVENENVPVMKVEHWSTDNSYSLAPEWSGDQIMYSSVLSTDEGYTKEDLQDMADDFNNDDTLSDEYKKARKQAVDELIEYNKRKIKDSKEELAKLIFLQQEIGKLVV